MKVSIITVVYNNEQFIGSAIQSVLSQTYPNIEYIIIDGASTDRTMEIVNSYREKIKIIISEPDKGLYDAMNKGMAVSTGDVIGILNSDDVYYSNKVIEDVVEKFAVYTKADAVYGNIVYCRQNNIQAVVRKWITSPFYNNFFRDGEVPPHPALFIRRAIYKKAGGYNLRFRIAADYEFMFRCFNVHRFSVVHLNKFLVRMRLGGASNGTLKNIYRGNREIMQAWSVNGYSFPLQLLLIRPVKKLFQYFG